MKILLLATCFSVLTLVGISQSRKDTTLENTFLWEVSGQGLSAPSYLFGTMHGTCAADVILPSVLLEKLKASRIFYIETLLGKGPVDSAFLEGQTENGIKDLIGESYFKKTKRIFDSYYGLIEESRIDSMNTIELGQRLMEAGIGCRIISYDDSLYKLAKNYNLEIRGLEFLTELKNSMPRGTNVAPSRAWIRSWIDRIKSHPSDYKKRIDRYKGLAINWLYKEAAYTPGMGESPDKDKYLDGRNKRWLPRIESSMKEGPSFFAFGCAHLAGWEGIISLLRQNGYTVTPIFYSK